ncbi:hypothetical protein BCB4_0213 [Bacillus phage B4]|uniref:Uncharacterized protein n=2 Tax=Bequatrovirus B4 TaxID=1918005 RepID=J9QAI5_9CAUD|nr:hypothetical protein BCB4_0213 [Bacillus phage B4]YP_009783803.1 hypothetical protein QLX26_gp207 [Bacillus phage B5S]MEB9013795.1 hypothetical protein [Bacillus cereus]AEW47441.1 hypothetical protein B5S_0207 [Bacillus phage B5S]AEZ66006.1 hypothetical protein BCB4_0213 [Bacillus phage B4]MEB9190590.1 hypothetical protein [Bacillus cereus]
MWNNMFTDEESKEVQALSEDIAKEIQEHLEMMGSMTPEELEDFNTRMYLEQYFKFFKDVYGENPKYDYTRDGDTINVKVYPYMPLEYITVDIKI